MNNKLKGLNSQEVEESRKKHGDNSLYREKRKGFFGKFVENLNDPIIKVLIIALVIQVAVTFGNCNYFEVFGIVSAILIATVVSTLSEWGSEKAFSKMQTASLETKCRVLRDGNLREIKSCDIVVGDIVFLAEGDIVCADGEVIYGEIKVDQSALNGESREVRKAYVQNSQKQWKLDDTGRVYRGTVVTHGECYIKISKVGAQTYYGMVAKDVQTQTRESPLKLRLNKLASDISKIGYIMAAIVSVTYLFNTLIVDNNFYLPNIIASVKDFRFLLGVLTHTLTLVITVIVVAAPEGLPMMITVVLSANMKKMLRDGVLVKKLVGIETAGSMNILFTDKTGTITSGKMECDKIITKNYVHKSLTSLKKTKIIYEQLLLNARYNTNVTGDQNKIEGGNSTDRAIYSFFAKEKLPSAKIKDKTPFSSKLKYSNITLDDGTVMIKGAPDLLISIADSELDENGSVTKIDRDFWFNEYSKEAMHKNRVIAMAYKSLGKTVIVALIVLKDRIRAGVRDSVIGVKNAGVQVVMMTGDGIETATAIAKECGILSGSQNEIILTSETLSKMSDDEVKKIIPRIRILARALPQDKSRLVRLSQELELVVGMTGDGINDAPSLKLSDVGFAMGNGSDIAKGAGDIVILDNSFHAINRTILYGRTIFKSIRKFIVFQLMMNLCACGVSLFGQFLGIDSPITIVQMLWVNIIMDTLGGLAFAGESALEYYMKEKPKKRREPILNKEMLNQIIFTGGYTLFLCIMFLKLDFFYRLFRFESNDIYFMTAFYALFIFAGIFNCFGARCERVWLFSNLSKNKPFIVIMGLIATIQCIMIYYGGDIFRTRPLTIKEFAVVILLALSVIPFELVRRVFYKISAHK